MPVRLNTLMKALAPGLVGLLLQTGTLEALQDSERLTSDERAAALAAVEWFAGQASQIKSRKGSLVISGVTSEWESSLPSAPAVRLTRAPKRTLGFDGATVAALGRRQGLRVAICGSMAADYSLCGIAPPWVWIVVSTPAVEGSRARLELEARTLETGPRGERDRMAEFRDIVLKRSDSGWKVLSATPAGVS